MPPLSPGRCRSSAFLRRPQGLDVMDFQRILIFLGLAVTAYMLILAWNEDYGQGSKVTTDISADQETLAPEGDASVVTSELPQDNPDGLVPSLDATENDAVPLQDSVPEQSRQLASGRLVDVTTDVFAIKIDLLGGDMVSGALPKYPEALETPDIPFVLMDPRNNYSAQSGLIGRNGTDTAKARPTYLADSDHYEMNGKDELTVDLRLPRENGVQIIKRFTFRKSDYLIDVEYLVDNQSTEDWRASLYTQIKRDGAEPAAAESSGMGMKPFTGGATFKPGSPYTKLDFDDIAEEPYKQKVEGGYIALVQHYFVSAWIPSGDRPNTFQARKLANQDIYLFGFTSESWQVPAGASGSRKVSFYLGPKDQKRLEQIATGLNLTVDYGFLWWLAQPLFYLLTFIHGFVNNWGVAIIFLTIIVKSLLYPLSAASFRSMAKMRKLQPEMARLKERFGDDKQQFSQAMMELYKKEGANPLGGCLPMLLQMPVFLALYWSLMESVELRQAPFFLWIHDLSAMDPYFVLPILMGISMFVTQMLQPEPPDPVQAKVFKMMPIMFTFFFLWFPSGLVLYWLINNLLSILQQWYVTRQIDKAA